MLYMYNLPVTLAGSWMDEVREASWERSGLAATVAFREPGGVRVALMVQMMRLEYVDVF